MLAHLSLWTEKALTKENHPITPFCGPLSLVYSCLTMPSQSSLLCMLCCLVILFGVVLPSTVASTVHFTLYQNFTTSCGGGTPINSTSYASDSQTCIIVSRNSTTTSSSNVTCNSAGSPVGYYCLNSSQCTGNCYQLETAVTWDATLCIGSVIGGDYSFSYRCTRNDAATIRLASSLALLVLGAFIMSF